MEMLRFPNVLSVRGQKLNLIQEESVIFAQRKDYGTDTCFTEESLMGTTQTDIFSKVLSDRNIMLLDRIDDNVAFTLMDKGKCCFCIQVQKIDRKNAGTLKNLWKG